jgi:predicted DNA-binding protein YlxM (UPF0122 family)
MLGRLVSNKMTNSTVIKAQNNMILSRIVLCIGISRQAVYRRIKKWREEESEEEMEKAVFSDLS